MFIVYPAIVYCHTWPIGISAERLARPCKAQPLSHTLRQLAAHLRVFDACRDACVPASKWAGMCMDTWS